MDEPSHVTNVPSAYVMSVIENELQYLHAQKAATDEALHAALLKKRQLAAMTHTTSPTRTPTIPLRGPDRAAWERAIIEDEMSMPLKVDPATMQKLTAADALTEQRLAAELQIHMQQLQILRSKLAEREASVERRHRAQIYEHSGSVSPSRNLSSPHLTGDAASRGFDAKTHSTRPYDITQGDGARSVSPVAKTHSTAAHLTRLEALERRIQQLESGLFGGTLNSEIRPAWGPDRTAEDLYESLVTGEEQHAGASSAYPRGTDGGTGSPATPPSADPRFLHSGYVPGRSPGSFAGSGHTLAHSMSTGAVPMSVALLSHMTQGPRLGGAGSRSTSKMPRVGHDDGRTAPSRVSGGRSTANTSRSPSRMSGVTTKSLPNVKRTNILGYTFTKDQTRISGGPPGPVTYSVARNDASRGPGSAASRLSRPSGLFGGADSSFPLTAVPESIFEDEVDPIDQWIGAKQREVSNLLRDKRTASKSGVRRPGGPPPKATVAPYGAAAGARRPAQAQSKSLPPSASRAKLNTSNSTGNFGGAVAAQRSRLALKEKSVKAGAPPTAVASMRQQSRTAVKNATLTQFADVRKDFEAQRLAIRSQLQGSLRVPRGVGGTPASSPPPASRAASSLGMKGRPAPSPARTAANLKTLPPSLQGPPPIRGKPSTMSRSASVPARLRQSGSSTTVGSKPGFPAPSRSGAAPPAMSRNSSVPTIPPKPMTFASRGRAAGGAGSHSTASLHTGTHTGFTKSIGSTGTANVARGRLPPIGSNGLPPSASTGRIPAASSLHRR